MEYQNIVALFVIGERIFQVYIYTYVRIYFKCKGFIL